MKLKLKKLGEAAAVGIIDIALEKVSPTAMDIGRGIMFSAGIILNAATDEGSEYSETLYLASTPLVIRSIANKIGIIPDFRHKQIRFNKTFNFTEGNFNPGGIAASGATNLDNPEQGVPQFK